MTRNVVDLLYKRWDGPESTFGDVAVIAFMVVQFMDGFFTYHGVRVWGPAVEANPIISSAMTIAGPLGGLAGAKLVAIGFGMLLHLRRVHNLVALLTLIYVGVAILPWTALFLTN
jgi:hypothetical protein